MKHEARRAAGSGCWAAARSACAALPPTASGSSLKASASPLKADAWKSTHTEGGAASEKGDVASETCVCCCEEDRLNLRGGWVELGNGREARAHLSMAVCRDASPSVGECVERSVKDGPSELEQV